jgi:hypothetical protein
MKYKSPLVFTKALKKTITWLQIYELHIFHYITEGKGQLCVSQHQAAR